MLPGAVSQVLLIGLHAAQVYWHLVDTSQPLNYEPHTAAVILSTHQADLISYPLQLLLRRTGLVSEVNFWSLPSLF